MRTFWLFNRGVSDCDLVHREDSLKKNGISEAHGKYSEATRSAVSEEAMEVSDEWGGA